MSNATCESCGMPIEAGPYCRHCVDDSGKLQPFEERFERRLAHRSRKAPSSIAWVRLSRSRDGRVSEAHAAGAV